MLSKESIALAEKQIAKNRKQFDKWLQYVRKAPNDEEALYRIWGAAMFGRKEYPGILCNSEIEHKLLEISQRLHADLSDSNLIPNSFLHVFTSSSNYGGHSRVPERWIANSDETETHSVLLTDQRIEPVPQVLYPLTESRKGQVFVLPTSQTLIDKAITLRKIAMNYEKIILHIHSFDVVPLLAFGTLDFPRPVVFMNHSDHVFWLGSSISDVILNFRKFSYTINSTRRGIDRNLYLPLPIDISDSELCSKENLEKKVELGIPSHHKVLLSMARNNKYIPMFGLDFASAVEKVFDRIENLSFVVIGPTLKEKYWRALSEKYPQRVHVLGIIPNEETKPYLSIADLTWDSFPMGSLYALMESAKLGIPVLSLNTPGMQGIYDSTANITCNSVDELIQASIDLLQENIQYRGRLLDYLRENNSGEGWKKHLNNAISQIPKTHRLWSFEQPNDPITEFELFMSTMEHSIAKDSIEKYFPSFYVYLISRMQKLRVKHPQLVSLLRKIVMRI